MVGLVFRIVLACLLVIGAWKALGLYALYRYGEHMRHCFAQSDTCRIVATDPPARVAGSIMRDIACVRQRQTWYEVMVMRTPRVRPETGPGPVDVEKFDAHRGEFVAMCKEWGPVSHGRTR